MDNSKHNNQKENKSRQDTEPFKAVSGLIKDNCLDEAWSLLESCEKEFSDVDYLYAWKAQILYKKNELAKALKILELGLEKAVEKQLLYERMGFFTYEAGKTQKAVKWWIKSVEEMVRSGNITLWEPFLYLAHVAKACGCRQPYGTLMDKVSQIFVHGELSFEPMAEKMLMEKASDLKNTSVPDALGHLCRKLKGANKTDPAVPVPGEKAPHRIKLPGRMSGVQVMVIGAASAALLIYFVLMMVSKTEPEPAVIPPPEKLSVEEPAPPAEPREPVKTVESKTAPAQPLTESHDPPSADLKQKNPLLKTKNKFPDPGLQKKNK